MDVNEFMLVMVETENWHHGQCRTIMIRLILRTCNSIIVIGIKVMITIITSGDNQNNADDKNNNGDGTHEVYVHICTHVCESLYTYIYICNVDAR